MKCNKKIMKATSFIMRSIPINAMFLVVIISGCAPAIHRPLDSQLTQHNVKAKVASVVAADEITAYFEKGTYTSSGGGLLFVLIDNAINTSRASEAEERVAPLLEASADINFRKQYWAALEETMMEAKWLKASSIINHATDINERVDVLSSELPLLYLNTAYELSSNAQVVRVQTSIRFYLSSKDEPDYFGAVVYISDRIGSADEEDDAAIELWAMDEASALRKVLSEGIAQNMKMLKYDLLNGPKSTSSESKEEVSVDIIDPYTGNLREYNGILVKEVNNRLLVREEGGNLFSIPRSIIE